MYSGWTLLSDIIVYIAGVSWLGYWLGEKFRVNPWGLVLGITLGTVLMIYNIYKYTKDK